MFVKMVMKKRSRLKSRARRGSAVVSKRSGSLAAVDRPGRAGRKTPQGSSRLLESQVVKVLGSKDAAAQWLRSSQPALGGRRPIDSPPAEVRALLKQIQYDVYI